MNIKSIYKPHIYSTTTDRPLAEIMDEIYTGVHQQDIQEIRSETDRVKQNFLKRQLPMFYPSIMTNAVDSVPTGLIQFDLNVDDNPNMDVEQIRNAICNLPETIYCFYSARNGLKFALRTDFKMNEGESTYSLKERYKQAYTLCKQYVLEHVHVEFDNCCQNIKQACFVSFDSDIYFDEDCSILYVNDLCEYKEKDYLPVLNKQFSESCTLQILFIVQNIANNSTTVDRYTTVEYSNRENPLAKILTKI